MALQDIVVPQMGEGLQEVSVVAFHKRPGDFVKRDEALYSMETDKAVVDVESPYEGTIVEWLAGVGDTLPIGAPIARIETDISTPAEPQPASEESAGVQIPPRTRAYAKEHGIADQEMRGIPAKSGKLMPEDIDAYLAAKGSSNGATPGNSGYAVRPLSDQQQALTRRMHKSAQEVIPATLKRPVRWLPIVKLVDQQRKEQAENSPTEFQAFAYCVAQAVKGFPKFRSTLSGDDAAHEYAHVNLGIAVARDNDDLVTAVVPNADALSYPDFIRMARERISSARGGLDQAGASTQFLLTYMGAYGVMDATPVLVAPAIAILFIGATYEQGGEKWVNLSLTIDHRLINGVEAAKFLNAVIENAERVEGLIG